MWSVSSFRCGLLASSDSVRSLKQTSFQCLAMALPVDWRDGIGRTGIDGIVQSETISSFTTRVPISQHTVSILVLNPHGHYVIALIFWLSIFSPGYIHTSFQ